MRNPFRREPAAAIATGVNELLRRSAATGKHDPLFWQMHGGEKLRLWLSIADQYRTGTAADVEAISQFKRELSSVAEALEALEPGQESARNPDCIRGLVFSNCVTYDAQRHFRSPAEMWETYVKVLQGRQLLPHIATQPSAGEKSVSTRRLTVSESGAALTTALEVLGSAAEDWRRATSADTPQARDKVEFLAKWTPAFAVPTKVNAGLADLAAGLPPDEYMDLYEAFVLAVNALISKWQADLAAYSLLWTGKEVDANVKIAESDRNRIEFYRFWRLFQVTFQAMEVEHPETIARLRLSSNARAVIPKEDWFTE